LVENSQSEGEHQILELEIKKPIISVNMDSDGDYELIKTIRVPYVGGDQEVENVGLQTWRASLLLAEYVHFNSELFIGTHILELGAGSSLPTLIANRFASTSSTDVHRILPLTRLTFKLNSHLLNDQNECRIFPLDWSKEIRNFDRYYDIVLAAECCYNRDTSKNLFSLINWLFREEKIKMAIFTLEERPNFMLDSMSVRSTERDRFLRHLSFIQANHQVIVEKIDTADIPELFTYDRSRLVLYKVTRILSRPGTWTARPCVH